MLSYAFHALNEDSYANIETEEFDNIDDLFAAILAKGIANQIKRGLGKEYINTVESLASPRGKIDISTSIKHQTLLHKQLICNYDEYSLNSYLNKVLKTTVSLLIHSNNVSLKQKKSLKKVIIFFDNVDILNPYSIRWSSISYHRNNATYKMLINICYLVIYGMLLTTEDGNTKLSKYVDDQKMHTLFEKFVLEYYRKHFPQFKVTPSYIDWNVDDDFIEFLPAMKTDITIEYKGKTIIIDTKYYGHTMQTNTLYNSKSMHSNNMYQIFTYVKNRDIDNTGNVSGILLYAKTDEEITPDHSYMISGNNIKVKTLDLNKDFSSIKDQLNFFVKDLETL